MIRFFRFSPSRLALAYIVLSLFVLALFAIPLWSAWRVNLSTFRAYVLGEDMQRLVDIFHREGAKRAISRSIVEAHGGRLWATANAPHGAVFQFTLPIGSERMA